MASFPASRRAQAAHEFLTTYAWAFLVVLFALLFMLLAARNPGPLLPERCDFPGSGVECLDARASLDGMMTIRLGARDGNAVLFSGGTCVYGTVIRITAPLLLVEERTPFLEVACTFDGDNPFAGKAGRKTALSVRLILDETTYEAPVRVWVEG